MLAHPSHIRRIYSHPWRDGSLVNPGKVSTCVQVGVRPETTLFAHETMSAPAPRAAAAGASLACVRRIDVLNRDSDGLGLVLDKLLQLPKRPAMQPRAHAPARLDPVADVSQILQPDFRHTRRQGLSHNGFTGFVIDVFHAPHLLAGGLLQRLSGALAAVGLKTPTPGKVAITSLAQALPTKDLAQARGSEIVLSDIHAHRGAGCYRLRVFAFDHQVEEPVALAKHQLGFLRLARFQDPLLVLARAQRNPNTTLQSVQRQRIPLQRVGALVIMNGGAVEANQGNGVLANPTQCPCAL